MKSPRKVKNQKIKMAIQQLLNEGAIATQVDLCEALHEQGIMVNQSTISRILRQVGAVKTRNSKNEIVYCFPKETAPPPTHSPLSNLVINIQHNKNLVVIHTSPGSAPLIGRILDHNIDKINILGLIAGDDTIFVTPRDLELIKETHQSITDILKNI